MPTYQQNKNHAYKWRENNRTKHNEQNSKAQKRRVIFRRESRIYLNILL
jgi:hypothetical protein